LRELSPRDIQHDNPEFRRHEELIKFLEQIYGRSVTMEDVVTVVRFSQILDKPAGMTEMVKGSGERKTSVGAFFGGFAAERNSSFCLSARSTARGGGVSLRRVPGGGLCGRPGTSGLDPVRLWVALLAGRR